MKLSETEQSLKLSMFRDLLRIRRVEERIAQRYPEQEMRCPVHLSIGQEAVAVGVCRALNREDRVVSAHRGHAHYLAKGGDLGAMIAEIYGKETGCCRGRGGSMHLMDLSCGFVCSTPIVGGSVPLAVGFAFSSRLKGDRTRSIVFLGDAATEEGVVLESLNFAALKNLPVLFVCENNFYSIYTPLEVRQSPQRSRLEMARSQGVWSASGNGNRAEEVFHLATAALSRIDRGEGPAFLEFDTYRMFEHCGPNVDDSMGYRSQEEIDLWRKQCPVEAFYSELLELGEIARSEREQMEREIALEIDRAFEFARNSPFPA